MNAVAFATSFNTQPGEDYLRLLGSQYPTIQSAATEIINLSAVQELPKGTEHFLSDLHGEYEAFIHVLRNGSGVIRRKIDEVFGEELSESDKSTLATLIYYPEEKMALILRDELEKDTWFRTTLFRLILICRVVASKYTRSKVRKALPQDFAYIIEELLHEQEVEENKQEYYQSIIDTIISIHRAQDFIVALANLIQNLAIDRLHIIGDIYDRGPGAHIILDKLIEYDKVDIQWGNHDILWMGAAAGSTACIANAVRISLRYANTNTLEDGYGISLLPLATFAMDTYGDDPCSLFVPKENNSRAFSESERTLMAKMHKAISIIQFKLEAQVAERHPQYKMQDRMILENLNLEKGTVTLLNGKEYPLLDTHFPTVDPHDPYALSEDEEVLMEKLLMSFENSDKLQKHVRFLYSHGSMYLVYNDNLLYHGCISMNEDGSFRDFIVGGEKYNGRAFMDRVERLARQGYFSQADPEIREYGQDAMLYLWCGDRSPLYGKSKMATFERYFIADDTTHIEEKDFYYKFRDDEKACRKILQEFGLHPEKGHIINGHVPVRVKKGESPIKANGRLIVIDGGLSKAYQTVTGIAGYTLIYNSHGMNLVSHKPFESKQKAIAESLDIHSRSEILESSLKRIRIRDTHTGQLTQERVNNLLQLLKAYRSGMIKERI